MELVAPKTDFGVIIGRFQVHELHSAHKELIQGAIDRHKKVLVLLGVAQVPGLDSDPLDYRARKIMIQNTFPEVEVFPIHDQHDDHVWSKNVDTAIRIIFPFGSALIYGGRDSFIPYYDGRFQTAQVELKVSSLSGTEVRDDIRTEAPSTPDGRAGVIYASQNKYANGISCVDIVPFNQTTDELLLGRKPGRKQWRMLGGFFDPKKDETLEQAAKREAYEETGGCEVSSIKYVGSRVVDDPRFRKAKDKIITSVFVGTFVFGNPRGNDDIEEVKWFNPQHIKSQLRTLIEPEHVQMISNVMHFLASNKEN